MPRDMADMLDPDHRVGGVADEPVIGRVDEHPDREAVDDRRCKRFRPCQFDVHLNLRYPIDDGG